MTAATRARDPFAGLRLPTHGKRFEAIADALADAIGGGSIIAGTRLPTQRDLARRLGVNVNTVNRAYAALAERGLASTFGDRRGTLVTMPADRPLPAPAATDLTKNRAPAPEFAAAVARTLAEIAADPGALAAAMDTYAPPAGTLSARRAIATWLADRLPHADAEHLVLAAGSQNALASALAAVARTGDSVLAEALTNPGLKVVATFLGLRLVPVALDAHGMLPEALRDAQAASGARVLVCTPTLHNPTTVTMPASRRKAIAAIAAKTGLTVIEDDAYNLLLSETLPTLGALLPDQTVTILTLSKSIGPGLRVAPVVAPPLLAAGVARGVRASVGMAPPLMVEILRRWISTGDAGRVIAAQRATFAERARLVVAALGAHGVAVTPDCPHAWLQLAPGRRSREVQLALAAEGIMVSAEDAFAVAEPPPVQGLRISASAAQSLPVLATALARIAYFTGTDPASRDYVV